MEDKIKIYIGNEEFEVVPDDIAKDYEEELIEKIHNIADEIFFHWDDDYNEDEKVSVKIKLERMVFYMMLHSLLNSTRDTTEQIQSDVDEFINGRIEEGYWEE